MLTKKLSLQTFNRRVFSAWVTRIGYAGLPHLLPEVIPVQASKTPLLFMRDCGPVDGACLLDDPSVSTRHAELRHRQDRFELVDLGSTNGTFVNGVCLHPEAPLPLHDGDVIQMGGAFLRFRVGIFEEATIPRTPISNETMTSVCPEFLKAVLGLRTAALSGGPVLIHGETGTGKELFARALHDWSGRDGDYIAINTAGLQAGLIPAELFGVERGAHSAAEEKRVGLIRSADKGTVLLDEIGDMPLEIQPALLRILQEKEVLPVGADRAMKIDVRFIAATHRELDDPLLLRPDLVARLRGTTIEIPAMRDRIEDVGLLIARVLVEMGDERMRFTPDAYARLCAFYWPENVRQLVHALRHARFVAREGEVTVDDLNDCGIGVSIPQLPDDESVWSVEFIKTLLREHRGSITRVAAALRVHRMKLTRFLKKEGIDPNDYRARPRARPSFRV